MTTIQPGTIATFINEPIFTFYLTNVSNFANRIDYYYTFDQFNMIQGARCILVSYERIIES